MAKLRQRLRRTAAAAVSAALLLTAAQMPALTASAAEPVLRMNLLSGGSVIGIGWQLEAPDGLSGYSVTLDGKKVRPEADGTFSSYDYAAYMTQPHTVTVRKGGRQILKKETSVCSYLNTLLADSESGAYHNAAKAMLVYGGAAQAYFGIDTEHPADAGIDTEGLPKQDIPEDNPPLAEMKVTMEGFSNVPVRYTGMNLSLQSEIQFSLFFEPKAEYTAEEAEEYLKSCTFGGEPAVVTPYGENGFRMSRTVNVKDLGETIVLEEPEFGPCDFRPTQYLYLAEQSGDEALIRVCKALYNYGLIAQYSPNVIREIGLQMDEYWDWMVSENHAYMIWDEELKEMMLGEDDSKKFELSLPEQLCIERTDKSGQTVKIPVLKENTLRTDHYWEALSYPEWVNQTKYEAAEHTLCSGDPERYWSHVSARFGQGSDTDVLMLYFTLYQTSDARFGIQSLKLDENGKLTVRTSICNENDYGGGEEIYAYRFELPKGALSGEWMPEDTGEQPPEEEAVIRGIHLDTDYYYDLEEIEERAEWGYDWEPEPDMLTKDPEAFRASLPDTLCIERTDGTGRAVKIPVLKQEKYDGWYCVDENNPWYYQKYEGPEWLKKKDYKAAERNLCDPMVGMQRVAARLEQGEETDVLLLYFTWNFMSGDLELRNLKFDENGKLTVGVSFCRTTQFGWGEDLYAYRLELPHGALTNDISGLESGGDETEPVIRKVSGGYTHLPDVSSYEFDPNQEEMWWESYTPETLKEYLIKKNKQRYSQDPVHLENTDASGETKKYYVRDSTFTCMDLSESFGWDGVYQSDSLREIAPSWMTQADYDALDEMFDSHAWISARLELCGDKDVLVIYHKYSEVDGDPRVRKILFENGSLSVVFSTEGWAPDFGDELLDIIRLEFPAGAFSGSAEPDADRTVTVIPPLKAQPDIRSVDLEIGRYSLPYWLYLEQEDSDLMSWGLRFPVLNKQTAVLGKELDFSNAPEWLKQEDYEAAEAALVSGQTSDPSEPMDSFRVSAKFERGEDVDVLYLYFTSDAADGSLDISHLYLDRDGKLRVSARFFGESDVCSTGLYAFRLEFPAGAIC